MFIDEQMLAALIKSHLPYTEAETCDKIAKEIIRDAEAVIHSMIRRVVSDERKQHYEHSIAEKPGTLRR